MSRIELHIDTLLLRGLEGIDRNGLAQALQQALEERLAATQDWKPATLPVAYSRIGLPAKVGAQQLGTDLAHAITGILGVSADRDGRQGPVAITSDPAGEKGDV